MTAVMKCMGVAGPYTCTTKGQYLKSCDFEYRSGRGLVSFTPHLTLAMKFPDKAAAMKYWKTQSQTVPYRTDGKPNRPLTSYHVEIVDILEWEKDKS